jgi:membrane protease YdiL (CAAX protease family)
LRHAPCRAARPVCYDLAGAAAEAERAPDSMREPPQFTTSGQAPEAAPDPIGSPVLRAACFSALIYVVWMFLAGWFHPSLESLVGGTGFPATLLLYFLCLDGFALALSAAFISALDGRSFRALGLWFFPGWWRQAAAGAAAGAATISLVALAVTWWRRMDLVTAAPAPGRFPALLAFFLLSATFEELIFRGYAWQRLEDSFGALSATLISSLLFGLAHAANPRATPLSIINTTLAGVLMCVARWRSRALWMPLGLHFGWNVFLGAVFLYPVSGYRLSGGAGAAAGATPNWLTGGDYGLEGSVVLTGAVCAAIFAVGRCPRKLLFPFDFPE